MKPTTLTAVLFSTLALAALTTATAHATARADRASAIVTYPLLRVDGATGVDTFVQLINTDTTPVDVACFLENHTRHCVQNPATLCASNADCPAGDLCAATPQVTAFQIGLTARQPLSWQAKDGLGVLPHPANTGSIPAVPEIPFTGTLRCVAVDGAGDPVEANVLVGAATLERYDAATPALDAASYNAIGLAAIVGAGNGDGELILGGTLAEYEGCPNELAMSFFFDFGIEPATGLDELITDLTLTPCGADFTTPSFAAAVAQFMVYNEFEQRFSTSRSVDGQLVSQLSLIDTNLPERSIFSAGVAGTLAGKTLVSSFGSGSLGVAIERHRRLATPQSFAAAGFNLHAVGERLDSDVLRVAPVACSIFARNDCRTAARSSLSLADRSPDRGDRFLWKLRRGQATSAADFGQPQSATNYSVCIYSGAESTLRSKMEIPASASLWSATASGFRYSDSATTADGVRRILLKGSSRDRSAVQVRGQRESLPDFALDSLTAPVRVQLHNDTTGICWESTFNAGEISENSADNFKASQ